MKNFEGICPHQNVRVCMACYDRLQKELFDAKAETVQKDNENMVLRGDLEEAHVDCIRLQQEVNCLRMEPCQLPKCVEMQKEFEECKVMAARLAEALEDIKEQTRPDGIWADQAVHSYIEGCEAYEAWKGGEK